MAEISESMVKLSYEERKALSELDESLAASSEIKTSELQKFTTEQIKSLKETLPKESELLAKLNHLEAVVQANKIRDKKTLQGYNENEVGGKDKPESTTQASNLKENEEIKVLREKIAKLESGKSQEEAKKALGSKVEGMRAEGYTDLYILSRLMANGVFSTSPLAIESKIIKSVFGWNIIPVYNAMAGLTKKSIEWNGIGKDALIEKLGTEEKYAKTLRDMIDITDKHLQGTALNTEIERLKGIDATIATLEGIRTELEKDPIDHKKVSAEFERYLRMSGQYLRLDDTARASIKADLEAKNKTLSQAVTTAQNAEQIAKKELDYMHAHNKQIETDVRAKERELANLKSILDPSELKFMNKWKSEAVLIVTSSLDWSYIDQTRKDALIADAKADPGKHIPNPDSHPNIQALYTDYENKKAPYDAKQQEIGTLKNTVHTPDDIAIKQDAYEDAKKKHIEIKAEHTQKSPKYNSLLTKINEIDSATDPVKKARLQAEFNKEYATVNPTRMAIGSSAIEVAKNEEMNKIKKGDPGRTGSNTVQPAERIAAVDRALAEEKAKKKPIDTTRSSLSLTEKADAERMKAYVDDIHDKIQQVNKLAQEKVTALSSDPKIQSGDEFYKEANKILNETNSLVEKYNKDVMNKYGDATHKLTPLQKADFDKMLVSSVKAEKLMAANAWFDKKIMDRTVTKGYFGGLMVFAIGSSAYQVGKGVVNNDARAVGEGVVNIVDTGVGFIPVVGGVYDLGTSAIFTVKGLAQGKGRATDWNGKEMTWTELGTRVGFGTLGLIPYVGTAVKAAKAAKLAEGTIDATKAVNDVQKIDKAIEASQLTMKVGATAMIVEAGMSVVWSTGKWGYALAIQDQPVSITGAVVDRAKAVIGK